MNEVDHETNIIKIFKSLDKTTFKLAVRETNSIELKESFNWGSKDKYARTIASFANNKGGYLLFGITNNPRILVGLQTTNFENIDEADITSYLNGLFSPEIDYEKFPVEIEGRKIGVIYTHQSNYKPIIAIKNDGSQIKEAEIYYRYNARNDKIKYAELKSLFDQTRERERKSWMSLFEKVSKIGPSSAAILDVVNGTIEGENNSLLIDKNLLPKLKFINEGKFSEKGKPVLKLIGDVRPVTLVGGYKPGKSLRFTNDPLAPPVREETVLKAYPFEYSDLVKELGRRYSDFKINPRFHSLKKELAKEDKYCRTRYLDYKSKTGTKKDFYSLAIIEEFDKHYTKNIDHEDHSK